jgi:hypothetical protein
MGNPGGGFNDYAISYPGGGAADSLALTFFPDDPSTAHAIGVNLYENGALLATTTGVTSTLGTTDLTFSSPSAGPILAQVYNYTNGTPVTYQLGLSGPTVTPSPATAVTAPAPSAASSPSAPAASSTVSSEATSPVALTGPMSGTLVGNSSGTDAYYAVPYAGGVQSVTLTFSPDTAADANGLFVVFDQNGANIGSASGSDASTPGNLVASYHSNVNGTVLIQIGNYNSGTPISYTITP